MREFGQTQEVVAEAVGKSRSHVANLVRLLSLPDPVLELINGDKISAAHGRLLVGRADAELLAAEWARTQITVRDADEDANAGCSPSPSRSVTRKSDTVVVETLAASVIPRAAQNATYLVRSRL